MADAEFWKKVFAGFEEATPLAFGLDDVGLRSNPWKIPPGHEASRDLIVSAWVLLLSRFSGDDSVTVGFQSLENAEVQPLRLAIDESLSAAAFLESLSGQMAEQLAHPIDSTELCALLQLPEDQELFKSTISQTLEIRGEGCFSEQTLARIGGCLQRLMDALVLPDTGTVRELEILSAEERKRMLNDWNPDPVPYTEKPAHILFEQQVAERPDATALVLESEKLTYAELNARANQLAHGLMENGVKPGQCVAMLLERGLDQIVAALAIMKAGGTYVPLDPSLPKDRIEQMEEDVLPPLVLTNQRLAEIRSQNDTNPNIDVSLESLAYVIFTSGSTGRPKGVEMPHRGLVRLISSSDYIPLSPETVMLQMASIAFDVSVYEIWAPLLNGGVCVLCPYKVPTMEQLKQQLAANQVNTLLITAAFFNLIIKEDVHIFDTVKYMMVGGEALSAWHIQRALKELPDVTLMNGYGPTENAVNSTVYIFDRNTFDVSRPIPIGPPIANSSCYVLDRFQRPLPIGVPGELYVGGDGVARGYAARPDLTEERFLPDPFRAASNARMYRTGDLVYWNAEGLIEFIGRVDNQIKLRGFRMELAEIEATLGEYPEVDQAVVVLYDDEVRGKWLCGYLKVDAPESFDTEALLTFAHSKLPDYMIPSALVPVAEWHFTPNGKIDRKALPRPEVEISTEEVVYASETEQALAEIWKELLGLESVPRTVNFFELGGNSLKALTLFLKIHQQFGRDFTLATLIDATTIEALALEIDKEPEETELQSLKMIRQGDDSLPPIFWFHGGDGHVLLFKLFAENLRTNHTIYAFQYAGLDGRAGEPTVEEMAQSYVAELRRVYPKGPVHLAGYCIGGYVVMEVARLLKGSAVEVIDPIVAAGSPNVRAKSFHHREPETSEKTMAAFEAMCAQMERAKVVPHAEIHRTYQSPDLGWLKQTKVYGFARRMRTWKRLMKMSDAAKGGQSIDPASRGWYCGNITAMAGERHRSRGYDGDMLYFRSGVCHGSAMGFRGWWSSLFMGFEELCHGKFEGIVVGGLHEEILKRPEVAELIKDRFEQHGN
ncbi:amino acid adenylation domain-containing protein [Pontiellaceae bacterium B12219]|nr:amino acid adenylation domain-containing protein [Pontiellaceae bacterium B12219]